MIQNEVAILRRVKHPNIVLLIEEVDTYNELYLVMELVKVCGYFNHWLPVNLVLLCQTLLVVIISNLRQRQGGRNIDRDRKATSSW